MKNDDNKNLREALLDWVMIITGTLFAILIAFAIVFLIKITFFSATP